MTQKTLLTVNNHLVRDIRLDGWSVNGIGQCSYPTDEWVRMFLEITIDVELPEYLQNMFERAQACIVYGCYNYPLFTLGLEELFRFCESAFREAVKETGISTSKMKRYVDFQEWALRENVIDEAAAKQWGAARRLRNSVSHKEGELLLGPNDALNQLDTTKRLVEQLFMNCRNYEKKGASQAIE
ncbi:hypothetical protein [Celeribacter sp.]|uniref:hypothetical protein n=1 Tax=Celeribacter sp. TaxID=1890673 RepID=UPI003A953183